MIVPSSSGFRIGEFAHDSVLPFLSSSLGPGGYNDKLGSNKPRRYWPSASLAETGKRSACWCRRHLRSTMQLSIVRRAISPRTMSVYQSPPKRGDRSLRRHRVPRVMLCNLLVRITKGMTNSDSREARLSWGIIQTGWLPNSRSLVLKRTHRLRAQPIHCNR